MKCRRFNMHYHRLFFIITLLLIAMSLEVSAYVGDIEPISPIEAAIHADPSEVALGKILFNDKRLSRNNSIACASCHNILKGGDDGLKVSIGIDNQIGTINAPTVLNSGLNAFQFWDGRARTLEEQVEGPIHNSLEMGSTWNEVINKLKKDKQLLALFAQVYLTEPNESNISRAISTYEKQLLTLDSPFDLYLKGNETAISERAKKGYQVFKRVGCISCHQGQNVGGNMFQRFGIMGNYFNKKSVINTADYGRFNVTGKEEDRFKFKVPSLRNIELTAPYLHDGSIQDLRDVIKIMARYQLGRPISDKQVVDIEAFLKSLTGKVKAELQ